MTAEELTLETPILQKGIEIFDALSKLPPETSLSFVLTEEGVEAVRLATPLAEEGIGGNKSKLKETALECLQVFDEVQAGDPINVNFTEYELKSMGEVLEVYEKALEEVESKG